MPDSVLRPGRNIAMKIPPHQFNATVRFYRDVVGLKQVASLMPAMVFEFGAVQLWLDRSPKHSQAEIWLELQSPDLQKAASLLAAYGVTRCDEIEPLPEGFQGFWVASPASIVHLVTDEDPAAPGG